jgi:hypothetical protein
LQLSQTNVANVSSMANSSFVLDQGSKFAAELKAMLQDECGITKKFIMTHNPQANSMVECVQQVILQLIHTTEIKGKSDVNSDFGWNGVLAAGCQASCSVMHTTQRATPAQLVFGHNTTLNVAFEADLQHTKESKPHHIVQHSTQGKHQMHPSSVCCQRPHNE